MADLSSHLSSWMVVPLLICLFVLLCFPAYSQVKGGGKINEDTNAVKLPILKKDTLPDSTKNAVQNQIVNPLKVAKRTANHSVGFLKNIFSKRKAHDSATSAKTLLTGNLGKSHKNWSSDSVHKSIDTLLKKLWQKNTNSLSGQVYQGERNFLELVHFPSKKTADSFSVKSESGEKKGIFQRPFVGFGGGSINYNYDYRSSSDTPFAEKNIGQHNITGRFNTVVAGRLPLIVNFWIRRSNSIIYQDITDVQVAFDPVGYRNMLGNDLRRRMMSFNPSIKDSLIEKFAAAKLAQLKGMGGWLNSPFTVQQLHEYKELIQIDSLHHESRDTSNGGVNPRTLLVKEATLFLKVYDSIGRFYDTLHTAVDSLQQLVTANKKKLSQLRQLGSGQLNGWSSYNDLKHRVADYDDRGQVIVPDKYKWLMGIRNMSIGKTPVNYSELTVKNISITGINLEYNSWYYLAVTAGLIDYRFRDFVINTQKRTRQYLYMLRAGVGRLEKNYFIVSLFRGQKQLYSIPQPGQYNNTIAITGVAAESKWQLNRHTWIIAEAAQSMSPDYKASPPVNNGKFTLSGTLNKALSLKFYTSFPKLYARADGMYKYTGANYQSFSSYQTSAALKTWSLKWEQQFFKRALKLTASLKSNEFSNPYILQNYKSNTVFKSFNATLRMRKWPTLSIGYIPMSQLSYVGQQVVENRFQTLTASLNHFYKIGTKQAYTVAVYNRFFNTSADSGFVYFNASNFYLAQSVVFGLFTAGLAIADSKSDQYHLTSGEINLRLPVLKKTIVSVGVKINNLNLLETKTGGRFSLETGLTKKDRISINYEKSYLPGNGKELINNDMGNIQYSRYF